MDALIFGFLAAALASWGDRPQLLAAMLAARGGRPLPVLAGLVPALLAVAAIVAIGGAALQDLVGPRAQVLLVALGCAYAGVVGLLAAEPPGLAARFRGGPFLTALLFGFAFASGSRAQFVLLTMAMWSDQPALAAAGGAAGLIVATVPAALLGSGFLQLPLRATRRVIAALFLLAAAVVAINAPAAL